MRWNESYKKNGGSFHEKLYAENRIMTIISEL